MNRRSFLKSALIGAAALGVCPTDFLTPYDDVRIHKVTLEPPVIANTPYYETTADLTLEVVKILEKLHRG